MRNDARAQAPASRPVAVGPRKAAELLDVSESTILRLITAGKIPAFRVGRQWRIRLSSLAAPKPAVEKG